MADKVGPFDGVPFSQAQWYSAAAIWAPSGVIGDPQSAVTAGPFGVSSSGLTLTVKAASEASRAWIRGTIWEPEAATKTATATANAHASWSRRDRLVIRRDLGAQTVSLAVKAGTAAATPTAAGLTQVENGVWEESIFSFLVPPNNGTTLSGFVDERVWVDPDNGGLATVTGNLSLITNYVEANTVGGTPRWRRNGQEMALSGGISYTPGVYNATAGTDYTIATVPSGTAPATDLPFSTAFANGSTYASAWVWVRASGQIQYRPHTAVGPGFSIGLSGINWRIGY